MMNNPFLMYLFFWAERCVELVQVAFTWSLPRNRDPLHLTLSKEDHQFKNLWLGWVPGQQEFMILFDSKLKCAKVLDCDLPSNKEMIKNCTTSKVCMPSSGVFFFTLLWAVQEVTSVASTIGKWWEVHPMHLRLMRGDLPRAKAKVSRVPGREKLAVFF